MSKAAAAEIDSSSVPDAWPGEDLSIQYSAGACYPAALEPEIRLMTMIMEDAVNCFQRFAGADGNPDLGEFRDAERWLFGGEKDWIFSFENICAFLGLDPRYIRGGLRLWQRMNQHPDFDAGVRRQGYRCGRIGRSRASPKISLPP
ncbi:MAG: hypothetical protein Q8S00_04630 [Deltaproteobacteria bacterium]|nr:hypothetical protein [Deltaproteobacteria bacterium]MDZ4346390.1 hypothetical protein [Candidatus Binatia bacterium]